MGKTNRKKKLEKRKNYNPPGKILGSRGQGHIFAQQIWAQYPDEASWLCEQIYDMLDDVDDYCIDNERWCLVGDAKAEAEYENRKSHGCCGFKDKEVVHPKSGNVYLIGCNYGH